MSENSHYTENAAETMEKRGGETEDIVLGKFLTFTDIENRCS